MSLQVGIAGSDIQFPCADGQTLLDAALAAGIELPYSCRKGVCGNCAGSVVQGVVQGSNGQSGRNDLCAPGQVLFCLCTPTSDVLLQPQSWRRVDPAQVKRLQAKVFRVLRPADDVAILQLRLAAGVRARFKAGQYLQVVMADGAADTDGTTVTSGTRRSYSMANPPHENDGVTLHVRLIAGGAFSSHVLGLKVGDSLQLELPLGSFSLRDDQAQRPILLVAGGTGFAPIKSMLDDMVKRADARRATLIWGVRRNQQLYLLSAVERWQRLLPGFRFQAVVSDEVPAAPALPDLMAPAPPDLMAPALPDLMAPAPPDLKAPAPPDLMAPAPPDLMAPALPDLKAPALPDLKAPALPDSMAPALPGWMAPALQGQAHEAIAALCPSLADHVLYCCGAPPMVAAVRQTALHLGLAGTDFHSDVFVTTAPAAPSSPSSPTAPTTAAPAVPAKPG